MSSRKELLKKGVCILCYILIAMSVAYLISSPFVDYAEYLIQTEHLDNIIRNYSKPHKTTDTVEGHGYKIECDNEIIQAPLFINGVEYTQDTLNDLLSGYKYDIHSIQFSSNVVVVDFTDKDYVTYEFTPYDDSIGGRVSNRDSFGVFSIDRTTKKVLCMSLVKGNYDYQIDDMSTIPEITLRNVLKSGSEEELEANNVFIKENGQLYFFFDESYKKKLIKLEEDW